MLMCWGGRLWNPCDRGSRHDRRNRGDGLIVEVAEFGHDRAEVFFEHSGGVLVEVVFPVAGRSFSVE